MNDILDKYFSETWFYKILKTHEWKLKEGFYHCNICGASVFYSEDYFPVKIHPFRIKALAYCCNKDWHVDLFADEYISSNNFKSDTVIPCNEIVIKSII